jgi:2-polyprenyl-6-methoxyphenol hydroxylase-like FAD-dependent oxidoreductase
MAIEDAVALAESLASSSDIDEALRSYQSRRQPRVETIRAAVRRVTIMRGMEGPITAELLQEHPPVFSASLKAFEELIVDPFASAPSWAATARPAKPADSSRPTAPPKAARYGGDG